MSLIQTLIIHKFPVLFSILNEIKSNLNFDIQNLNNNDFHEIQSKKNIVIISGEKKKNFQNQINIDLYPVNIQKLIEMIMFRLKKQI